MGYRLKIRLHKKQEQAVLSPKRVVFCISEYRVERRSLGPLRPL